MKYIPSIAFEEMSGSAKGVTAAKVRGRKYIRNRGYGGSTRTEFQSPVKGIFKQLSTSWKALSNAQILAWNKLSGTQASHSVFRLKQQDLWCQPLHEAQLLDCLLRWFHYYPSSYPERCRGSRTCFHRAQQFCDDLHPRLHSCAHHQPQACH